MQETKPTLPSSDHGDCCVNDFSYKCDHSGTCSACSESTSSSDDEEANLKMPGFGWAKEKKPRTKSSQRILKSEAKKEKSAEGLKEFVYGLSIMDFYEMQKKGAMTNANMDENA